MISRPIYCEEGLNLCSQSPDGAGRPKTVKKQPEAARIDRTWSMDIVASNLFNERRIRALTVLDDFSRQYPAIHVDHAIKTEQVVSTMEDQGHGGTMSLSTAVVLHKIRVRLSQ